MQHCDEIIGVCKTTFLQGLGPLGAVCWSKQLEQLFLSVYTAGYNEAKRTQKPAQVPRVEYASTMSSAQCIKDTFSINKRTAV